MNLALGRWGVNGSGNFNVGGSLACRSDGSRRRNRFQVNVCQFNVVAGDFGAAVQHNWNIRDGRALYVFEDNFADLHA